jgi:hypothetical protein
MPDATINAVYPTINKKRNGMKQYAFAIEGTNFVDTTVVTVILTNSTGTYEWEIDGKNKEIHQGVKYQYLYVQLKRKPGGPDTLKDKKTYQLEQITVTVSNPPLQAQAATLPNVQMGTFDAS